MSSAQEQKALHELNAAIAAYHEGRLDEAAIRCETLLQQDPAYDDALYWRGKVAYEQGCFDSALLYLQSAIRVNPTKAFYYNSLARVMNGLNLTDEAIAACQTAIDFDRNCMAAYYNRGLLQQKKECFEEAIADFKYVINRAPHYTQAWYGLADTYTLTERWAEAKEVYEYAIKLSPGDTNLLNTLAIVYKRLGNYDKAASLLDEAITYNSQNSEFHLNRGLLALLQGQLELGWKEYEWRYEAWKWEKPAFPNVPEWDGISLSGKTLLVFEEQGLGDSLQFYRYLVLLAEQAKTLLFFNKDALFCFFKNQPNKVISISQYSELKNYKIDYTCSLLGLPYRLKTRLDTIPANIPYLQATRHLDQSFLPLFDTPKWKIGFVWRGNPLYQLNHKRSCEFDCFKHLFSIPHCQFYSLQKVNESVDFNNNSYGIIDLGPRLDSFEITAAIAEHLDLLISVDTGPVHLFGALGKPVWLLLDYFSDWRWMLYRQDSPWYPLFHLFRQKISGDWGAVFKEVQTALEEKVNSHR